MVLIAQKPCSFGGRKFFIGEDIPPELVVNPKAQEKMGVLAIAGDATQECLPEATLISGEVTLFSVPILQKNGEMVIYVDEEELQQALRIMQMSTNEAKETIKGIKSEALLILLNACDSRKPVKHMTEAVAAELTSEESAEAEVGDE